MHDPDEEHHYPIYQVVGAYDGMEWKETGADFRGKWHLVTMISSGDGVYLTSADFYSLPDDGNCRLCCGR